MKYLGVSGVAALAFLAVGCGTTDEVERDNADFQRLYSAYREKFNEQLAEKVDESLYLEVLDQSNTLWEETFKDHADLLRRMAKRELDGLASAAPVDLNQYEQVGGTEEFKTPTFPYKYGICGNAFLFGPVSAAKKCPVFLIAAPFVRTALDYLMVYGASSACVEPEVEAIDRDVDRPKLQMYQGPIIIQVDLVFEKTHYLPEGFRIFYRKSKGTLTGGIFWTNKTPEVSLQPNGSIQAGGKVVAAKEFEAWLGVHCVKGPDTEVAIIVSVPAETQYAKLLDILYACDFAHLTKVKINGMPVDLETRYAERYEDGPDVNMWDPAHLERLRNAKDKLPWGLRVALHGRPETPLSTVLEFMEACNKAGIAFYFADPSFDDRQPPPQ